MAELPMPGNVLQTVVNLSADYGNSGRFDTEKPEKAQVTTSIVNRPGYEEPHLRTHRPVLDIDIPAKLIPSSTKGHFHLYLDVEIPHTKYMALLLALEDAGIIEPGYLGASVERGYTAVRLPWVEKKAEDMVVEGDPF